MMYRLCSIFSFLFVLSLSARKIAAITGDLIEIQADKYTTNLATRKTEVEGNVRLRLGDRELFADKVLVDPESGEVQCEGHIKYRQGALEIDADDVRINLKTGRGTFKNALIRRPGEFQIEGKEVVRVDETIYTAKIGKISFCQDCPQSWSLAGDRIRINTERYAEIHHAVLQIKDVPVFYLPLIYYPAKERRFTGFLIPYFKYRAALGAQIGIPFFWAPTDDLDFTYDYRYMSLGGHRHALETRAKLSDYSFWNSNTSWIRTPDQSDWNNDRFGIHYEGRGQFAKNWAFVTRGDLVSDAEMSQDFESDSTESRLPQYSNDFHIEAAYENFSLYLGAKVPQDNLERESRSRADVRWTLPELKAGVPLTSLFPNVLWSARVEELSARQYKDGTGQTARDPATGFIASGDRGSGVVELSVPLNLEYFRLQSEARVRSDFYQFHHDIEDQAATQSRFYLKENLETDFSRIWDMGWQGMPRMKHVMTPFVSYSFSPRPLQRSSHEFFQDCPSGNCPSTAPRLDLWDGGVSSEDVRLGTEDAERRIRQHSIVEYGIKTQLIGKFSDGALREFFFMGVSQDYDLAAHSAKRLKLSASGNYEGITLTSQAAWDFNENEVDVYHSLYVDQPRYLIRFYQNIRPDTDTLGGELRLKKIGPFELAAEHNFDRKINRLLEQRYFVSYASYSKCWRIDLGLRRLLGDNDFEYSPSVAVTYAESIKSREDIQL